MLRRLLPILLAATLVVTGCDREPSPVSVADPETLVTLPSCDSLADTTLDLLQAYLDAVAGMSLDEVLGPSAPGGRLAELDAASAALTTRAAELGCTSADLSAFVAERADDLRAEGPLAERYLELVLDRVGAAP